MTSAVSGKASSVLPCSLAGRPRKRQLQRLAVEGETAVWAGGQRLGLRGQRGVEGGAMQGGRALDRDAQRELALFGNAFLAADQPAGLAA